MRIALTGATGFVGRYIAHHLVEQGHTLRCWHRPTSDCGGLEDLAGSLQWTACDLDDTQSVLALVAGCDAVVHAAFYHPGGGFRGGEGDLVEITEKNIVRTVRLIKAAQCTSVGRFVLVSTCAVYEKILDDQFLDEKHSLWPKGQYGAHTPLEQIVHHCGLREGYSICSLRPTGGYGLSRPADASKWFDLVSAVVRGQSVTCQQGGMEVHARDVARAVALLLKADGIAGEAYNCCDRYVSAFEVAMIANRISGNTSEIQGRWPSPKHQIDAGKLQALGMTFGGAALLEETIAELVQAARR